MNRRIVYLEAKIRELKDFIEETEDYIASVEGTRSFRGEKEQYDRAIADLEEAKQDLEILQEEWAKLSK